MDEFRNPSDVYPVGMAEKRSCAENFLEIKARELSFLLLLTTCS
jgi:hypothetical protein